MRQLCNTPHPPLMALERSRMVAVELVQQLVAVTLFTLWGYGWELALFVAILTYSLIRWHFELAYVDSTRVERQQTWVRRWTACGCRPPDKPPCPFLSFSGRARHM